MKRHLAAILAADVVGYTRLMSDDEAGTLDRLQAIRRERVQPKISVHGGRIVKFLGDGLLAEFPSVVEAVQCAVDIQKSMLGCDVDMPEDRRIHLRIGVNLGDIIVEGSDIYGDGVNLAARLEGIAEPDCICISGDTFRQVRGKIEAQFKDLGQQKLKNITEPVSVYHIAVESLASEGASPTLLPLPDKPSIVVLPFDDMSSDSEDPYFADGMTEDIITELSHYSSLFVIARNSAFTYKGRAVKIQDVRRDLGVRYVVEGSVRRAGDKVRVTVQLIDSETGNHIWADRYDHKLGDIFDLQDKLTQAIVATLPGQVELAEQSRIHRKPPQEMAAYDYVVAGRIHHHRVTPEDNSEALRLLDSAIQLDPEFAEAYAWKACTLGQAVEFGYMDFSDEFVTEVFALADKALLLDENDAECHRLQGEIRMETDQMELAEIHNNRALELNSNDPRLLAQRGELLTWIGRAEEGVEWIEKAMRIDPMGAPKRTHLLGHALYCARRYEDSIVAFKKIVSPTYMHLAQGAACHAQIGDQVCATELATAALRLNPEFSVEKYVQSRPYQIPADAAHLAEGLRAAGLPK